jgi:RNA polymerase sigma factor (sigma-70 family)
MSKDDQVSSTPADTSRFATTHWSVVLAAGSPESTRYHEALEVLCRTYWFPLYAYLRRRGQDKHQAEDSIQGFFANLLEKRGLRRVDPQCGKFRSFMLVALKHFLADQRGRKLTQKRGGGKRHLSLDFQNAEDQYALELAHNLTPEKLFEKSWALTVLERTMARLKAESASAGKQTLFDHLKVCLLGVGDSASYRQIAAKLGMTEGAVKVTVYRLRRRYRELLRHEIVQTLATADEADEEIKNLFAALAT